MNRLQKWLIWGYINRKVKGGDKMFIFVKSVLAWIFKNNALLIGVGEAIVKAITGIIDLTPTKKDDKLLPKVDKVFSAIKRGLYNLSEFMAGKQ
jgi:hypothetical protein